MRTSAEAISSPGGGGGGGGGEVVELNKVAGQLPPVSNFPNTQLK